MIYALLLDPFSRLFSYMSSVGIDPVYFFALVVPVIFWFVSRNDLKNWKALSDWDKRQYIFAFIAISMGLCGALLHLFGLL